MTVAPLSQIASVAYKILQQSFDFRCDGFRRCGGFKPFRDIAVPVHQELCEVPFDLRGFVIIGIFGAELCVKSSADLVVQVKTGKAFLALQPGVERVSVLSVDIDFSELGVSDAETRFAESVDFFVGSFGLTAKLIAGEIEDLESLCRVLLIQSLQSVELRSKPSGGR